MNELDVERLYRAWASATAETRPALDAGVRRRVLLKYTERTMPRAVPIAYRWALGASAVALVAAAVTLRKPTAPSFPPSFQVAGQLGQIGAWVDVPATQDVAVQFSEGTLVSLAHNSRARISRVTHGGAHIELASGSVDAEVTHLPGADWTFGAGPFEVAVTGTHLNVLWEPASGKFELSVSRGSVRVQGPFIVGPQAVRAGQVCRVDLNRHSMELAALAPEPAPVIAEAAPPATAAAPATTAAPASNVEATPAPAVVPPSGNPTSARVTSAESLLDEARAARLAGRTDLERTLLLSCRKRAKGQPAAAQAAYLLGRASAGGQAADWFETYLREEPQGLLAREAAGRLIESYRAAGNAAAAEGAASRYLARYPNGPHAALARHALAARSESQD
jgi:TolA-binding protein